MKKLHAQKGFTLVELAIVLTIIGLLIGGILKGQQLMENARITATIAQVRAIEAATTTFHDTYSGMPGDIGNPSGRIPGCSICGSGNGDSIVGPNNWDMAAFNSASFTGAAATALTANQETVAYWVQLAKAGLLSGVTDDGMRNVAANFGNSLPSARIGGGFIVGFANTAAAAPPGRTVYPDNMSGIVLALSPATLALTATAGVQVLSPSAAAQVDRKMDDGIPGDGFVQAYGFQTSCYNGNAATNPGAYSEAVTSKDCGLYFRIQG